MSKLKRTYQSGDRYGRLVLTGKYYAENKRGYLEWVCDCGKIGWSLLSNIFKANHTTSCGCLNKESLNNALTTHGLAKHKLYHIYYGIKTRCYNIKDPNYGGYGAIGVKMCDEWKNDFIAFFKWAILNGWKDGLQIDKDILAPNKIGVLYCPEYCCIVTRTENIRYRRLTVMLEYKGDSKPLAEWCEIFKLKYDTVKRRINTYGWSAIKALETNTGLINRNAK